MVAKTFIHIGLQKTATTFFQENVFPILKEVLYIGRPYTQENKSFNCLQYADDSIYSEAEFRCEIQKIQGQAGGRNLLLSDELFAGYAGYNFSNRGQIARRLSEIMPNAEVILFLRDQVDLISSLHNQYVKSGWVDRWLDETFLHSPGGGFSLEKWLSGDREWRASRRHVNHHGTFIPDHFDYQKLVDMYLRYFPKIHVFLYEEFIGNQDSCLRRLSGLLCDGITYDGSMVSDTVANRRIAPENLDMTIIRNKLSHVKDILSRESFSELVKKLAHRAPEGGPETATFVRAQLQARDIYQSNRKLNDMLQLGMERFPGKYL